MKVTCEECNSTFKVKGEVSPGKAFKFKCPKCGAVNRLVAGSSSAQPAKTPAKVKCEDCGESIFPPDEGPALCDQCRASRAVEEARKKSQDLMEDSELDFPDEIFDGSEATLPGLIDEDEEEAPSEEPEAEEKADQVWPDQDEDLGESTVPLPFDEEAEAPEEVAEALEEETGEKAPSAETEAEKPVDPDAAKYEVRSKDGLVIGPVRLDTLRDLIIARKVRSDEECRHHDGEWMGMLEFPELFEIFEAHEVEDETAGADAERERLLESLKVKKECAGCGAEIYVLEDIPHPLCDQCRIEALVTKKQQMMAEGEPRYKIRSPDGLVLGPIRKNTIEDLAAAGNIHGHEEVSINGGEYQPIIEVEELTEFFEEDEGVIDLTETVDG